MTLKLGEIIALAGLVLLLLSKMGGRRQKRGQPVPERGLARYLAYSDFLAFGFILAGLVVMSLQK